MSKAREDEIARQAARALRAEGLVPLHDRPEDADVSEHPSFRFATTHAMLSVAERLDLVTWAKTRITKGEPALACWTPLWVAELSEARQWGLRPAAPSRPLVALAEASAEVREETSALLAELRLAVDAARMLGGDAAVTKLREARRAAGVAELRGARRG